MIKITNIMNVEWWYILYTNIFTFIIFTCMFYYKINKRKKLMLPFLTMVISCTLLGIAFIVIPHYHEIHFILKCWLIFLVILILIPMGIYIIQSIKNKKEIQKIENQYKDNIQKYDYYRDIIQKYSPAILSLVYNRKIQYADTLVATILDLELKNYIQIEDKGIQVFEKDTKDIPQNEKYIYDRLKGNVGKSKLISFDETANIFSDYDLKREWKYVIKEEAEKEGLCSSKLIAFQIFEKICVFSFFALIIISVCIIMLGRKNFNIQTDANLISCLIVIVIHLAIIFGTGLLRKFNKRYLFVRTKKGLELQSKMSGLKNYIKDYSELAEKDLNQLKLWDDYLIYAVIFNLKGNLDIEARKLYEKLIRN